MQTVLPLIDLLQEHRAVLKKLRVTARDIDQEQLPAGIRLTLQIYIRILEDGLSVLTSLLDHLETTKRYTDTDSER